MQFNEQIQPWIEKAQGAYLEISQYLHDDELKEYVDIKAAQAWDAANSLASRYEPIQWAIAACAFFLFGRISQVIGFAPSLELICLTVLAVIAARQKANDANLVQELEEEPGTTED